MESKPEPEYIVWQVELEQKAKSLRADIMKHVCDLMLVVVVVSSNDILLNEHAYKISRW